MPHGYYKHRRTGSLKKEIEHVINKELKEETQLKYQQFQILSSLGSSPSPGVLNNAGFCVDLSALIQGDPNQQRAGDIVHAKTLRIRGVVQGYAPPAPLGSYQEGTNVVRFIVFSFAEEASSTTVLQAPFARNLLLELFTGTASGTEVFAPHVSQGQATRFKIHLDETHSLQPSAGSYDYINSSYGDIFQVRSHALS